MPTVSSFVTKFSSLIVWVLSCFDRVIFKGHLPISRPREFEKFVDYRLKMQRGDFLKTAAPQWSERIIDHAKDYAEQQERLLEYRQGHVDKDAWAKKQIRQHHVREGLWASCVCRRPVRPSSWCRARGDLVSSPVRCHSGSWTITSSTRTWG